MAAFSKCHAFLAVLTTQIILLVIYITTNYPTSRSHLIYNQASHRDAHLTFVPVCISHLASNSIYQQLSNESIKDNDIFLNVNNDSSIVVRKLPYHWDRNNTSLHSDTHTWITGDNGNYPHNTEFTQENSSILRSTIHQANFFQPVDNRNAWVYSAYFDHVAAQNGKPRVRVFGVVHQDLLIKVYCHLIFDNINTTTSATFADLPESHDKMFHPTSVDCGLSTHAKPLYVSISFTSTSSPTNQVQVQYPGIRVRNFTVCYSVLHKQYNKTSNLIQSIEMNRILGAEHFMVYNNSISPQTDQILRQYQEDGLVTVLPWPLPTSKSWYFGQITALCDCIYRNRNASRFVVVVDTDELIIPTEHSTWMDLIKSLAPQQVHASSLINTPRLSKGDQDLTTCFIFRSSFFECDDPPKWNFLPSPLSFTEEEKKNVVRYQIHALSQFWRSQRLYQFNVRSKYIAFTDQVDVPGIHYVHKLITLTKCLNVTPDLALLHHYRCRKASNAVIDTSILKFKHKLYPNIMKQFKRFANIFP